MIYFKHKGDFSKTSKYLKQMKDSVRLELLNTYGKKGVAALAAATPVDSGFTASSWSYEIDSKNNSAAIVFTNSNDEVVEKSKIIIDGKEHQVERILKDGTNYIKIRDLADALNLDVSSRGNIAVLSTKK